MAHTTFISYKYSESRGLRDKIISKLGDSAKYYRGEDSFSDNLSSFRAETIKSHLKEMINLSSVIIVILSPNMRLSKWMEWEIQYSLRRQSRDGRYSNPSGIVCVIKKDEYNIFNPYQWFLSYYGYNSYLLFDVIKSSLDFVRGFIAL